jgi:hypothetical protein
VQTPVPPEKKKKEKYMVSATASRVAQSQILKILEEKIVGHAIHSVFKALQNFHPMSLLEPPPKCSPQLEGQPPYL